MVVLSIIKEGDPRLRQKASRVRKVDDDVRNLAQSMLETIEVTPYAIALAAPQVGVMRRIIAVKIPCCDDDDEAESEREDAEEMPREPVELVLANPEIIRASGTQVGIEGCLSIPGWVGEVSRAMNVTVKARDMDDKEVRIKASGFLARALQHEIDHLDGILFIDLVEDKSTLRYDPDDLENYEPAPESVANTVSRAKDGE